MKKLSGQDWAAQNRKAVTLMGMSGVGKSYLGNLMSHWGWTYYSCDYIIGTKYLADEKVDGVTIGSKVKAEDLSILSRFIGQLGDPEKGGLPLEEFKRRQKLYYDAECASLDNVAASIEKSPGSFVNDSTGSLCEIEDEALLSRVGAATLFVYLEAGRQDEKLVLQNAQDYPKPLFFPPAQFDAWLAEYMDARGIKDAGLIDPPNFSRWVFPRLFAERLPKYRRLADQYGVTVLASDMRAVRTEKDFITVVAKALDDKNG